MKNHFLSASLSLALAGIALSGCSENSLSALQPSFLMSWSEDSGYQPGALESSSLAFGTVTTGTVDSITVSIANGGNAVLAISDLYLAEASFEGGEFSSEVRIEVDPQLSLTDAEIFDGGLELEGGAGLEFELNFSPLLGDPLREGLFLVVAHELAGDLPIYVPITGSGFGDPVPDIYAKPAFVDFGNVQLGQPGSSDVLLGNSGPGLLQIGTVSLVGEDASQFSLDASALEQADLATGEVDTLTVTVSASHEGSLEAAIEVRSNDTTEDPLVIPVVATVNATPVGKAPVAVCGPTIFSAPFQTEQLDGLDSYDSQGQWLSYQWTFTPPAGSGVGLDDSSSPFPTTDPLDLAGTYTGELVVTNEDGVSSLPCQQLIEAVPNEDFRIEIFWDQVDDMDLHLLEANNGSGGQGLPRSDGDCYFGNCTGGPFGPAPDWGVPGVGLDDPSLDLDDITGLGPENINILAPAGAPYEGWYEVFVHDYPGTIHEGSTQVTVNIYLNGALTQTYGFSMTGEDDDYYVAKVHWPTGAITACNGLAGCP